MTKLINYSPLEEIDNPNIWEFEKTLSNNFEGLYDNVINRVLDSDTESKMNISLKNEKQSVHSDERFKEITDKAEGNIIKNDFLMPFKDIPLKFFKYYEINSNYLKYIDDNSIDISDTKFEESFQTSFKKSNIYSSDIDFEELYFVPHKKKNTVSLNKVKQKHFLIKKVIKVDKENTKSTNEKTDEKKENGNIVIIIANNENTEKKDIYFIGKKRRLFKVISKERFNIFNFGEYDEYSKIMINEALNENNKQPDNIFSIKKFKYSKITKKRLKTIGKRKNNSDLIRKKIKTRFYKYLKDTINEKLKLAGSKQFFDFLPQTFISNISKKYNIIFLNLTLEEILKRNLCLGKDNKKSTLKKYLHNLSVLEYLEKNKEISRKSNFNNIKIMKLYEIYDEYLDSKEFKMEISKLKEQKETDKYIKKYIILAKNLIDDFYY